MPLFPNASRTDWVVVAVRASAQAAANQVATQVDAAEVGITFMAPLVRASDVQATQVIQGYLVRWLMTGEQKTAFTLGLSLRALGGLVALQPNSLLNLGQDYWLFDQAWSNEQILAQLGWKPYMNPDPGGWR